VFILHYKNAGATVYVDRGQNLPGQPPHLAHTVPDFILIGSLSTELLPNAWRPVFAP